MSLGLLYRNHNTHSITDTDTDTATVQDTNTDTSHTVSVESRRLPPN